MPQWSRDDSLSRQKYPDDRWRAPCPRDQAARLLRYDHHVVWIHGRAALLRTYHWANQPPEAWPAELVLEVSFTYATGHPTAPADSQQFVASLVFTPLESSAERAGER